MPAKRPNKGSVSGPDAALAFFTRFGSARIASEADVAKGMAWHWLPGLAIGLICSFASCLLCRAWAAAAPSAPRIGIALLGAWLWLAIEAWISRGMHWDGVADIGDAAGCGQSGAKFWQIMKDSRLGAFGAMALLLLMSGQCLACALHLDAALAGQRWQNLAAIMLAPVWGRISPAWLAWRAKAHARPSLGAIICENISGAHLALSLLIGAACLGLPLLLGMGAPSALAICAAQAAVVAWLRRAAARQGGLSGDFFGCGIEASQLVFLICSI